MVVPSWLARLILKLWRWELVGQVPEAEKCVLIAAPHTANRDLIIMLLVANGFGVRLRWFGKDELFRRPLFGWLMRRWGGIPVNRRERKNLVSTMAAHIKAADGRFILAIAPEGTRSKTRGWKTGFYYIALQAEIPIVCGFIDFSTRRTGVGPSIMPTGDFEADMQEIRAFYAPMTGKYNLFSELELEEQE